MVWLEPASSVTSEIGIAKMHAALRTKKQLQLVRSLVCSTWRVRAVGPNIFRWCIISLPAPNLQMSNYPWAMLGALKLWTPRMACCSDSFCVRARRTALAADGDQATRASLPWRLRPCGEHCFVSRGSHEKDRCVRVSPNYSTLQLYFSYFCVPLFTYALLFITSTVHMKEIKV